MVYFNKQLGLAVLVMVMVACGSDAPEDVGEAAVRPVKLLTLEEFGAEKARRYPAIVQATSVSELTFQVSGMLQELPVNAAQPVGEGDLLARLDARDLQSQLDAARADFDNAEAEYQRAVRLAEGDAIAASEVEQRQSRRDSSKAQLERAEKALADSELRAPFAGVVAKIHVEKFQNVQAKEKILNLISTDGLEATINVPSSVIITSKSTESSSASVVFDAAPAVNIPASFKEATLEADSASQTYEVTFSFEAPEDLVILPGMNATLILESTQSDADATEDAETSQGSGGVAVPLAAVLSEGDKNFVWVIDPETMTASKRWVTIQAGVGETVIVTDGLKVGETIAGAGANYLAEEMKVRPWTD